MDLTAYSENILKEWNDSTQEDIYNRIKRSITGVLNKGFTNIHTGERQPVIYSQEIRQDLNMPYNGNIELLQKMGIDNEQLNYGFTGDIITEIINTAYIRIAQYMTAENLIKRAAARIERGKEPYHFQGIIYARVQAVVANYHKKPIKQKSEIPFDEAVIPYMESPEQSETETSVLFKLLKLCRNEKDIYILIRRTWGETYADIGDDMGISKQGVRQRADRLLQRYRHEQQ